MFLFIVLLFFALRVIYHCLLCLHTLALCVCAFVTPNKKITYLLTYVCICIFVLCILLYYCDDVRLSHLNKHYVHVGWVVVAVSEAVRCHGEAAN